MSGPGGSGADPKARASAILKGIRNAEIEERLKQLPSRKRMVLTYLCTLFVCTFPSNLAGFALVFLFYNMAVTYCSIPICEWIMIWSAVSIFTGLLASPYYCNPHSRTAVYNIVIQVLSMLGQIGLLIWGSLLFFTPGNVSDDCKLNAMPLWYMMLIELVLGYLNVIFFIQTIRSSYYSYNLYKLKEAVEFAEYEQSIFEMHAQEAHNTYTPTKDQSPAGTYASAPAGHYSPTPLSPGPPSGHNTNDYGSRASRHSNGHGGYYFADYNTPPPDYGSPSAAHSPGGSTSGHRYTGGYSGAPATPPFTPPFNPDFFAVPPPASPYDSASPSTPPPIYSPGGRNYV